MVVAAAAAPVAAGLAAGGRGRHDRRRRSASLDVARIGSLPTSLPLPSLPDTSFDRGHVSLFVGRDSRSPLLAAIESLLSAKVADGMADTGRHDPDRELFGQGLANLASPLFGGMPATGAIARTAVNVRAGARTRVGRRRPRVVLVLVVFFGGGLGRRRSRSPRSPAC